MHLILSKKLRRLFYTNFNAYYVIMNGQWLPVGGGVESDEIRRDDPKHHGGGQVEVEQHQAREGFTRQVRQDS